MLENVSGNVHKNKIMKNDFNYELPISWNDIPEEYKWV
jgi:hypothetical protein